MSTEIQFINDLYEDPDSSVPTLTAQDALNKLHAATAVELRAEEAESFVVAVKQRIATNLQEDSAARPKMDVKESSDKSLLRDQTGQRALIHPLSTPRPHSRPLSRSDSLSKSDSTPLPHFAGEPCLPDSELEVSVRSSLQQTGYQQLRRLDVVVEDGQVTLSGRLPQFYLLQLAQQAVEKTAGVLNIENGIEIVRD